MRSQNAVLIAGPTASGKSALALALARKTRRRRRSMPIPCRSIAICACSPRGPAPEEEARAPHRLYGHVDAAENYSVGRWCADASHVLAEARAAGRRADFCRRHRALFQGADGGARRHTADSGRRSARACARGWRREGVEALHAELARRDPVTAARLMPRDRSRILRALEVIEATGRPLADWHREGMPPLVAPENAVRMFLSPEREELVRAHRRRAFDAMLAAGALDEVRALDAARLARAPAGDEGARRAVAAPASARRDRAGGSGGGGDHGYPPLRQAPAHLVPHQMPGWIWTKPEGALDEIAAAFGF